MVVQGEELRVVEEESFDGFYRSEYAAMVRLAFVLTGRADVAEEIAQDAFLVAHRDWARVAALESPGGWLRRVVTNRCISSGRRHLTELRLLARLRHQRPPDAMVTAPDDDLWAVVRGLPRRQAQVLALAFVEDRSVADIAMILRCSEETVRTHLRRGRLAIAVRLRLDDPDASGEEP